MKNMGHTYIYPGWKVSEETVGSISTVISAKPAKTVQKTSTEKSIRKINTARSFLILCLTLLFALVIGFVSGNTAAMAQDTDDIYINEICAKNTTIAAGDGAYYDWVELYNDGDENVDISGFGLSDSETKPFKYTFPNNSIVPAKGYLLIFCDKDAAKTNSSIAGFGLSTDGDSVFLSSPANGIADSVVFGSIGPDISYGRLDTDKDLFFYFDVMSPEGPNTVNNILVNKPVFSNDSGFYDSEFSLGISCDEGCRIYYTTDGSTPTTVSTPYTGNIRIYDATGNNNYLSAKTNIVIGSGYTAPREKVDKAMIVNAIAVNDNGKASKTVTGTFFVGSSMKDKYSNELVISLVTDEQNLFDDETGIYVTGNTYTDWHRNNPNSSTPSYFQPANYHNKGKEWERPATVQVFSKTADRSEMVLSGNIGIRIHGGASRAWAQKSFSFYARSEYGASKLEYDFYKDVPFWDDSNIVKFDSIMIRNAGNDNETLRFRDKLDQKLFEGRNVALQAMTPAVVFINGEYWGHYELTEKLSDYYIQSHYGVNEDDVCMIKNNELEEGSEAGLQEWQDLCAWVSATDFSIPDNYALISEKIDIQSFIDYMSLEIYISNNEEQGLVEG